jgi:hypothetical protein
MKYMLSESIKIETKRICSEEVGRCRKTFSPFNLYVLPSKAKK